MLRLCIVGGLGRMGKALALLAENASDIAITSAWDSEEAVRRAGDFARATGYSRNPVVLTGKGDAGVEVADVVLDFSLPLVFADVVAACERHARPLVAGTTGIEAKNVQLGPLARKVAVVSSPNMAPGVNAVFGLCDAVARRLGDSADVEIVEAHHRSKRDAPSGTALEMARIIRSATGRDVPAHALRVGDVPGRHTIFFALKGETIEVTHNAQSRDCFAAGALLAARFVAKAPPGLYTMLDVIGSGKLEV